jgi:hypothetical protein
MTPEERTRRARIAAHTRWGKTADRTAATEKARQGLRAKFEREADPDGVMAPADRETAAESLAKAHYLRMAAARSAKAKKRRGNAA